MQWFLFVNKVILKTEWSNYRSCSSSSQWSGSTFTFILSICLYILLIKTLMRLYLRLAFNIKFSKSFCQLIQNSNLHDSHIFLCEKSLESHYIIFNNRILKWRFFHSYMLVAMNENEIRLWLPSTLLLIELFSTLSSDRIVKWRKSFFGKCSHNGFRFDPDIR